jgi:hypothetical protein
MRRLAGDPRIDLDEALAVSRIQQRDGDSIAVARADVEIGVPLMIRVRAGPWCAHQVLMYV